MPLWSVSFHTERSLRYIRNSSWQHTLLVENWDK